MFVLSSPVPDSDNRRMLPLGLDALTSTAGIGMDETFVFEEPGKSTIRLRPRQDGGLGVTWLSADGKTSMTAHLKPIDPHSLPRRAADASSAPITTAATHGDGEQPED